MARAEYSEQVATRIDDQVRRIIEEGHHIAGNLIRGNRELVDRLVDLLIERESIDGEELRQIVAEYVEVPNKEQFYPEVITK